MMRHCFEVACRQRFTAAGMKRESGAGCAVSGPIPELPPQL